jgi:hypothetical protein
MKPSPNHPTAGPLEYVSPGRRLCGERLRAAGIRILSLPVRGSEEKSCADCMDEFMKPDESDWSGSAMNMRDHRRSRTQDFLRNRTAIDVNRHEDRRAVISI